MRLRQLKQQSMPCAYMQYFVLRLRLKRSEVQLVSQLPYLKHTHVAATLIYGNYINGCKESTLTSECAAWMARYALLWRGNVGRMTVIGVHVHWASYLLSLHALIGSFELPVSWRHMDIAIAQEPVPYWASYKFSLHALIRSFELPVSWRHINVAIAQEPVLYDCIHALLLCRNKIAQPQIRCGVYLTFHAALPELLRYMVATAPVDKTLAKAVAESNSRFSICSI